MKSIKSQADIAAIFDEGSIPKKIIDHIRDYYNRLIEAYGDDYDPKEGYIVFLEAGDPLADQAFLEEKLDIRGGEDLLSITKEFVDYDTDSNLYDVLVIFSADFAMTYLIPNEPWVGKELLQQLQTFQNYQISNSDK